MATEVFLGKSTAILASGSKESEGRKFAEAVDYSQQGVCELRSTNIFEIVRNIFGTGKLRESLRIMNAGFEHIVAEALANQTQLPEAAESNLLQELIRETQDIQQIKGDILNIILAGKDTTMALLSNIWFVLARRPDIFEKLCAELSFLDNGRPSVAQLNEMKYLRYVVNEGMLPLPRCSVMEPS
jgi:cytochrome P450